MPASEYLSCETLQPNELYQLYGVVKPGSLKMDLRENKYTFKLTDFKNDVDVGFKLGTNVAYEFREGESIVMYGFFKKKRSNFTGTEVLTNHAMAEEKWDQKKDVKNRDY